MIETVENVIQLAVTGLSAVIAGCRALSGKRAWLLVCLYSGAFFLGDLYWLLYLVFYGETPYYCFIPEISWIASFLFLFLLLLELRGNRLSRPRPVLWLVPMFTVGMCAFFMLKGEYFSNALYAVLLTLILWQAVGGLMDRGEKRRTRGVYWCALYFCFMEYALWLSSWHWLGDTLLNPYFLIDLLLTLTFPMVTVAVKRAVGK